jgi:hypothetical protein
MSTDRVSRRSRSRKRPTIVLWLALGALVLALGAVLALQARPTPAAGTVGPRLALDETSWDFGVVPLGTPVAHTFVYRNVGDAPLVCASQPSVQVVEGC